MLNYLLTFVGIALFLCGIAILILRQCDTESKEYSVYGIEKFYIFSSIGAVLIIIGLLI